MRTRRFWSVASLASILLFLVGFGGAAQAAGPITAVITAPAAGTVSGKVTVSADVTDTSGLTPTVQFMLDNINGFPMGAPITQPPYQMTWDSGTAPNGSHEILVVATDSAGNTTVTSPAVGVVVGVSNNIPVIKLISPIGDPTGTVTAAAHVTDDVAPVTHVEFLYQLARSYATFSTPFVTLASFTNPPYQTVWDTTTLQNDVYDFAIQATDAAGNTATTPLFGFSIANYFGIHNPTIVLTTPADGSTVSGTVPLTATAADSGATVTNVQFTLDGANLGSPITQPPYTLNWDSTTVPNGIHDIIAIASNNLGGTGQSLLSEVTVSNAATPPPPTVSITVPTDGATVSGFVTLTANVADAGGTITSVQFLLDGSVLTTFPASALTSQTVTFPWDSSSVPNGSHVLTAVATNDTGQSTTSAPVSFTVSNAANVPPTVSIDSPADGATLTGVVFVDAVAADACCRVTSVQFQLDGTPLFPNIPFAPYLLKLDTTTISNGSHVLTAVAFNDVGQSTTSAPVTVTVSNAPPPVPPTVSMTAPLDGATVSGTVTVSAGADDTSGTVTSVQFLLDGNPLGAPVTAAPYQMTWDSTTVPNGSHALSATAFNDGGQSTTATAVTVTVSNVTTPPPPTVSITSPADGATLTGSVTVAANAADTGGQVTSVQFLLDGAPLGALVTAAPYQVSWDTTTVPNGSHVLTAVATNDASETATSAAVTVTVSNVTLPPPPSVAITAPANEATVSGRVRLMASAADSGGTVTQVQFFLNGSALSPPLTKAPYEFVWRSRTVPNGTVTLTAVATNDSGETTTSTPVMVTVHNHGLLRACVSEGDCRAPAPMGRELPATTRLISPP